MPDGSALGRLNRMNEDRIVNQVIDQLKVTDPQPMPSRNDEVSVQDLVIADIEHRKAQGLAKYGTLLQPFNGREALVDLYQELLDACCYVRQEIEERRRRAAAADSHDPGRPE